MNKGRILVVFMLVVASIGAYFPSVKSEQPWLSGRETFIYRDNIENLTSFISDNYYIYTIRHKNTNHQPDTFSIHSLDLATGETFTIQENELVTTSSIDVFKISGDYFVWALGKYSFSGTLYGINLKTKLKKKIEGISRDLNHISLYGSMVTTKSRNINATLTSIYVFDINKDETARKVVDLKPETKYFYNGKTVITYEHKKITTYNLENSESKEVDIDDNYIGLPERLINYSNGYLLCLSEFKNVYCYNFNNNTIIPLYKLEEKEKLFTEYNQDSRLIVLTRSFNKLTGNPAYISHQQYMVFDTKTEKLYEVTPLFEESEYRLARNNSSYDNKLVFLHYAKSAESEKTNCVIEYMEFPDSKDEEPNKYFVIDSKKRPCSLRSDPMICSGKIAYIEESLREEDYTEKIVIFSYLQTTEKGADCEILYSKDFDGYALLEGSITNYSVVVQHPVYCEKIGRCSENLRSYQFDAQEKNYKSLFGKESTIKNQPLVCQQTVGSKIVLLNHKGGVYYKDTDRDDFALHLSLGNISAYATSNDYCCFYTNNSTVYLALSNNLEKLDKLFEFPSSEVEKIYIKGDNIFLQTRNKINEPPFEKRFLVVYNIPKKAKFVVESKDYHILDGAFREDSLYYIINIGSQGYKYNRHRLVKQIIGDDYQKPLLQVNGYETLKIVDNPYTETLCVQRDLIIGDGVRAPIYESNIYLLNPADDSMVEVFQSYQINNFSLLSYFDNTIAMLFEDEETFLAKLISAQLGGKTIEQLIPSISAYSGFINIKLTEKYVNLVRNDFVKRDSGYICYSYK
jgi:hypothetical protein